MDEGDSNQNHKNCPGLATVKALPSRPLSFAQIGSRLFSSSFLPLLLILLLWSFLRSPIPSVNEPHYFCKAKHFWNPQWCANDFFLSSSNPHFVFYCCFGPLTEYLSLSSTTIIARVISLMLLAWGWMQMTSPLLQQRSQQCLAMCLLVLLQASVNFSGEWLVGGAESKVFSYAFGFWALGTWQQKRSLATAVLLGLAVAFHSLVGCWLTVAILMEFFWRTRHDLFRSPPQLLVTAIKSWREVLVWVACSLPGLLPSLNLLFTESDAWTKFAGNYLQVYSRLKHHLDPMEFESWRYISYAVMFAVVVICYRRLKNEPAEVSQKVRLLFGLLCASLIIAGTGVLLGIRWTTPGEMPGLTWRVALLKFYPFRLFDLLMPIVLGINLIAVGTKSSSSFLSRILSSNWKTDFVWIALASVAIFIPFADHNPSRVSRQRATAWLKTCQWVRENTPEDAVFITPKSAWAFKWYAHRAEYVSRKDCPQDASGILEWNARLIQLRKWKKVSFTDLQYDKQEIELLREQTASQYLIATKDRPIKIPFLFENDYFRIYRIENEEAK